MVRSFLASLRSLWRWLPVVWRDRQWDHAFMLRILRHKLELMAEFFESDRAMSLDAEIRAAEMRQVAEMLRYLDTASNDYCDQYARTWRNVWWMIRRCARCWWD